MTEPRCRPRVRPATAADAEALAGLVRALNEHQGEPTEHTTAATLVRDGLGRESADFRVLLAEVDGPVGYALFMVSYSTEWAQRGLYLYDLFVVEAARGQGVGTALLAALARLALAEGRTFLWWNSKSWNDEARAMYRKLGAEEEDIRVHVLAGEPLRLMAADAAST